MPDAHPQPPDVAANTVFRLRSLVTDLDPTRDDTPARCEEIRGLLTEIESAHQAYRADAQRAAQEQQTAGRAAAKGAGARRSP